MLTMLRVRTVRSPGICCFPWENEESPVKTQKHWCCIFRHHKRQRELEALAAKLSPVLTSGHNFCLNKGVWSIIVETLFDVRLIAGYAEAH
jgi:hypothetical protein